MFSCLLLTTLLATAASDTTVTREQRLEEVVVSSNTAERRISNAQIGAEQIQLKELKNTPALLGENDIMRSLQLLPGVKMESDASSGFQVRGGTSAQNAVLYDDAPVYNVGHLAGLFSAFNDDALGAATLYKGLIPAQFGDASAAVLDVTSRAGNRHEWHGSGSIGLLSAKGFLEGPLLKEKSAVMVSARRSYMDFFLKRFDDFKNNGLYFYDLNAKVDYQLGQRDQLFLSFFTGHDRTALEDMIDMRWSNIAASLSWLHQYSANAYSQTSLIYSGYQMDTGLDFLGKNLAFKGHIRQGGLRHMTSVRMKRHELNFGLQSMLLDVTSGEWQIVLRHDKEQRRGWQNSVWLNDVFKLNPQLTLSAGLRLSAFSALGGSLYYNVDERGNIIRLFDYSRSEIVKTHLTLEPRLSMVWKAAPRLSLKAGYTRSSQNIHALRNQSTSTPFDRYTMSSNIVKPQTADQLSAGVFVMTPGQDYDLSLEGYFRKVHNVLDYRDGKSFRSEIEIERLVLAGQGRSYGAELCLRKNTGRLTGWLAYTLSWSETQIDGINEGRWYTASNDRRHDVDIVAMYQLSRRWQFSAAWVYNSGQAFTAPSGKYAIESNYIYYYAERNGYRAPDYHHLDASAVWTNQKGRMTYQWVFGIYNIYNRYNPFLINFEDSQNGARTRAVQYSLFGIIPSVSFNLKF